MLDSNKISTPRAAGAGVPPFLPIPLVHSLPHFCSFLLFPFFLFSLALPVFFSCPSLPFPFLGWRRGVVVTSWSYQQSYSTSSPVGTGMGDVSGFESRRRQFISVCNQPPRSTQPFILSRSINLVVSCNRMFASSHGRCHLVNAYGEKAWCG